MEGTLVQSRAIECIGRRAGCTSVDEYRQQNIKSANKIKGDGLRVPTVSPPGCLATVIKPDRAWIPMLRFLLPGGSHLNPLSNGDWHLCRCHACAPHLNLL